MFELLRYDQSNMQAVHAIPKPLNLAHKGVCSARQMLRAHEVGFGALEILVDLDVFEPSCASCSRKFDHNSASDSLLLLLLSGKRSVVSVGVLGVRWKGETGARRLGFEAPGLASPACSRCSDAVSYPCRLLDYKEHTISPAQKCRDELQNLELLWVRSIEGEEMEEVVGDDLSKSLSFGTIYRSDDDILVNVILGLALFQEP